MTELKPCPFCGRKLRSYTLRFYKEDVVTITVDCVCGASINIDRSDMQYPVKDVRDLWNQRKDD